MSLTKSRRRLATLATATALVGSTVIGVAVTPASAAPAKIGKAAFGMHYLQYGKHRYPALSFNSVRLFGGNSIMWPQLQPTRSTVLSGTNPAVQQLDKRIAAYKKRGVQPLIVLGPTPTWAADVNYPSLNTCTHGSWPVSTCAPAYLGTSSAWGNYVRFLARRYHNVYFEVWNEPNLHNGWNDTIAKLARMQSTAYTVIHNAGTGDRLVSPTVAVTAGSPLTWLNTFFHKTGGKNFDVFGMHLYPSDRSAKGGYGPEWSITMLGKVRSVLRNNSISRQVWDTEANVGRAQFSTSRTFTGWAGAAMVARTYNLQLSSGVKRIFWYSADDRTWGGTWLEQSDYYSLTYAGKAERAARARLVGWRPYGCSHTTVNGVTRYTCKYHNSATGKNMLVRWTTGGSFYWRLPSGSKTRYTAIGGASTVYGGKRLKITYVPQYVVGTFSI